MVDIKSLPSKGCSAKVPSGVRGTLIANACIDLLLHVYLDPSWKVRKSIVFTLCRTLQPT